MDQHFSCPRGHRWSRPIDAAGPNGCPVCGAAPSTSSDSVIPALSAGTEGPSTAKHTLVPGYELLGQAGIGDVAIVFKGRDVKARLIGATDPDVIDAMLRRALD